jgi:hypothetical protein
MYTHSMYLQLLLQVLRVIEAQLGRLSSEVVWRGLVTTCLAGIIASSWATAGALLHCTAGVSLV